MQNKTALQAIFLERFKTNTTAHWIGKLEEQDLLCAPVRTLAEALADEQATINGMIMEAPGVVETVKVVGSPIHMSDAPVTIRIPPATLGQHTRDVQAELNQARPTAAE
jgi:formyl-CoA transferase